MAPPVMMSQVVVGAYVPSNDFMTTLAITGGYTVGLIELLLISIHFLINFPLNFCIFWSVCASSAFSMQTKIGSCRLD